jgi:hypothetical protein
LRYLSEIFARAGSEVADYFGGGDAPQAARLFKRYPTAKAVKHSGSIKVAGSGGIHYPVEFVSWHLNALRSVDDKRTSWPQGDESQLHVTSYCIYRLI